MSVIGIVCEFNPFHNGHKYLIDSVKSEGDTIVCVMSGNYVQRCEPAMFPKEIRTKAALYNGADIVLELPFVYATASAECFAYNAVKLLDSFGCDKIAFGTENIDVEATNSIVDVFNGEDFDKKMIENLEAGMSYPAARQMILSSYNMNCDVNLPNNILAVEYVKAIRKLESKMDFICVTRLGAGYNDDFSINDFASATHIRALIKQKKSFINLVPENCIDIYTYAINNGQYASSEKYNLASLAMLRSGLYNDFKDIANMSEGLENRISDTVKSSLSLNEIYDKVKTKRYTHSRIRRAVFSAQFGINKKDIEIEIPYCRLLGFNKMSEKVLGNLVHNCKLPFITKYSDIVRLNDNNANAIFNYEDKSTDFYNLITEASDICGKERTISPVKI